MEEAHHPIQSFIPVESEGTKTENPFLVLSSLSLEIKIAANIVADIVKEKNLNTAPQEEVEYANPKLAIQLEKQLAKDGPKSIFKALKSTETKLERHLTDVEGYKFKSSVEREMRTFKKQIETIKQFIKNKELE